MRNETQSFLAGIEYARCPCPFLSSTLVVCILCLSTCFLFLCFFVFRVAHEVFTCMSLQLFNTIDLASQLAAVGVGPPTTPVVAMAYSNNAKRFIASLHFVFLFCFVFCQQTQTHTHTNTHPHIHTTVGRDKLANGQLAALLLDRLVEHRIRRPFHFPVSRQPLKRTSKSKSKSNSTTGNAHSSSSVVVAGGRLASGFDVDAGFDSADEDEGLDWAAVESEYNQQLAKSGGKTTSQHDQTQHDQTQQQHQQQQQHRLDSHRGRGGRPHIPTGTNRQDALAHAVRWSLVLIGSATNGVFASSRMDTGGVA